MGRGPAWKAVMHGPTRPARMQASHKQKASLCSYSFASLVIWPSMNAKIFACRVPPPRTQRVDVCPVCDAAPQVVQVGVVHGHEALGRDVGGGARVQVLGGQVLLDLGAAQGEDRKAGGRARRRSAGASKSAARGTTLEAWSSSEEACLRRQKAHEG